MIMKTLNNMKSSIVNFLIFIKPRPYDIIKKNFETYDPEFKVYVNAFAPDGRGRRDWWHLPTASAYFMH